MTSLPQADFIVSPSGIVRPVRKPVRLNRLPDADFVVSPDGVARRVLKADARPTVNVRPAYAAPTHAGRSMPAPLTLDVGVVLAASLVAALWIASWLL